MKIKDFIEKMTKLFYPSKCPYCLGKLPPNSEYCKKCQNSIPIYDKVTKVYEKTENNCERQSFCSAPFIYSSVVRKAIIMFKFKGYTNFTEAFGLSMFKCYKKHFSQNDYDIITAVPLNKKRYKERSYNQSELLAREVSKRSNIEYKNLLKHCKNNKTQHELSLEERNTNIIGVYDVLDCEAVKNKSILLVDDIVTTKTTLKEICGILYNYGAKRVDCICLARTYKATKDNK